ncbi:hypothetical protein DOY81_013967 [Sarcophaga bullata]|nr:hypothetical protein DOY81_013967 [Sarcophaga bullata]
MLGKTPTGGKITTYKELCSLASDLNQPEMIYQFMQFANHNAAWICKLGAALNLWLVRRKAKCGSNAKNTKLHDFHMGLYS